MILIDMPMPGHCEECPLNDEYAECALLGKVVANVGRLPDCPLREVEEMPEREFAEWVRELLTYKGRPAEEMIRMAFPEAKNITIGELTKEGRQ